MQRKRCVRWKLDLSEGADIVLVKAPLWPYLDILWAGGASAFGRPTAVYHVSGEFAMGESGHGKKALIDERGSRARNHDLPQNAQGADFIVSYWALDLMEWLKKLKSIVAAAVPRRQSSKRRICQLPLRTSGSYTEPVRCPNRKRGETAAHVAFKNAWLCSGRNPRGYSVCAFEVQLPRCRFRADPGGPTGLTGKRLGRLQSLNVNRLSPTLRRDNGLQRSGRRSDWKRLSNVARSWKKNLRIHYPALRIPDSLFSDFDSHNFAAIEHRGYARVLRELSALQKSPFSIAPNLSGLIRYRCANLFFFWSFSKPIVPRTRDSVWLGAPPHRV